MYPSSRFLAYVTMKEVKGRCEASLATQVDFPFSALLSIVLPWFAPEIRVEISASICCRLKVQSLLSFVLVRAFPCCSSKTYMNEDVLKQCCQEYRDKNRIVGFGLTMKSTKRSSIS